MNLTSCDNCGVVLDTDKMFFHHDLYNEQGQIDTNVAAWDDEDECWKEFCPCPVCKEPVFKGRT